ncbi:MAG TPA: alpha/beta fold hydrolase, partial [Burkholderiaceae bacterium]|nr:alpha/beta fold hydrolase [Burkholderiaceae bacterium]
MTTSGAGTTAAGAATDTLVERRFLRPGGVGLHLRDWLPAAHDGRRGVLIVHGLGEHGGRYAEVAHWFTARGWRVRAHDHRGHGRSDGARGRLQRRDDLLDDALAVLADLAAQLAEPPLLIGHSLGGALAAQMALVREARVRGLVLSSPALDPGLSPFQKLLTRVMLRLAPDLAIGNGLDPERVSRDPATVRAYLEDPLVHDRVSARLVDWLVTAADQVQAAAGRLPVDTLLLVAGADALVRP